MSMATIAIVGAATAGAGMLYKGISSGVRAYKADQREEEAQKKLDQLSAQPYDTYKASPALQAYYSRVLNRSANPRGLSSAEFANTKKAIASSQAQTNYNATNAVGGNAARYLSTVGYKIEDCVKFNFSQKKEAIKYKFNE